MIRRWLIALLLIITLACNFPGLPSRPFDPGPTETPSSPSSDEEDVSDPDTSNDDEDTEPTATETATPTPRATATETPTPSVTPTLTPTVRVIEPGPPLVFNDPSWELVEWQPVPGTGEWEGTLRLNVSGGTPPYRAQIEDKPIVSGLEVTTRWRLCKAMPATVRVWSADDQQAETQIYVWELGCEED
jgi:hypothetical protein